MRASVADTLADIPAGTIAAVPDLVIYDFDQWSNSTPARIDSYCFCWCRQDTTWEMAA